MRSPRSGAAIRLRISGATAAMRCSVHGVKSHTETIPLANASVEVVLKDGQQNVHKLFEGKTDAQGTAVVQLQVPSLPAGDYKMVVTTKSALGEEKLEREVKVKAEPGTKLDHLMTLEKYQKQIESEEH